MSLPIHWTHYHHGKKQNKSHYKAHCKGCVTHKEELAAWQLDDAISLGAELELAAMVLIKKQRFEQHSSPLAPAEIDAELALMQALAEVAAEEEEDEQPDNGEIEILSEDEYVE